MFCLASPSGQEPQGELIGLASQHFVVISIYHCHIYFNKPLLHGAPLSPEQNREEWQGPGLLGRGQQLHPRGLEDALSCPLAHDAAWSPCGLPSATCLHRLLLLYTVLGHLHQTGRSRGRSHQCSLTAATTSIGNTAYLSTSVFTPFLPQALSLWPAMQICC